MREGAADGKGNNHANIIKKSGLAKRKHVFLCRPVFSSLSVATGWGMRYGAEEACPMCSLGFLGRLDGGVCHSRQGKESYTQEGAERGTNDPKYELMTLNMNYGIKRPPADNVLWTSGRAALNSHNVTTNRQSQRENMLFAAH